MTLPSREITVISDLHLGGAGDFSIMRHPRVLASFIKNIRIENSGAHLKEIVIAGDFVDFLAEKSSAGSHKKSWQPFIENDVEATLVFNDIANSRSFKMVFDELSEFIRAGNFITILLGNHDIELSFPRVRKALEQVLGTIEGKGFRFIYDGEAYVVGDVLIEHGNRYDDFNQVDYDSLRSFRSLQSRGQHITESGLFSPPAGSRLVSEVINPIKQHYHFVDLLKPEFEAVLPILTSLKNISRLKSLFKLLVERLKVLENGVDERSIPVHTRLMSRTSSSLKTSFEVSSITSMQAHDSAISALPLLPGDPPSDPVRLPIIASEVDERPSTTFSSTASVIGRIIDCLVPSNSSEDQIESLYTALLPLKNDRTFDQHYETHDSPYAKAARDISSNEIRCVIFGHTHLAKDITFDNGVKYLNTGTWSCLMKIPDEVFSEDKTLAIAELTSFYRAICDNELEKYLIFKPTYVRFTVDNQQKASKPVLADWSY